MCPFCRSPPAAPGILDARRLSEFLLNDTEFSQFRKDALPASLHRSLIGQQSRKLRVVGFNEDTKNVLKLSNPQGNDYVEVPWSSMDSDMCFMQNFT